MSENEVIAVSDSDPDRVSRLAAALADNNSISEEEQGEDEANRRREGAAVAASFPPPGVTAGAVANLCSATLGAGVLAVPYSMAQAGVLGSLGLLAVAAGATLVSIRYLVQAVAFYQCDSYEQLTQYLFGSAACNAVQLCIVLFCEGCAVAYLIAVADILEQADLLLHESRALTLTLVWSTVCVPLSMLRRVQALQFTSALGVASIATLLFAALVHLGEDLDEEYSGHHGGANHTNISTAQPVWNDLSFLTEWITDNESETKNSTHHHHHDGHFRVEDWHTLWWPLDGMRSVLQACPVILFAFSCQVNVCAIFLELPADTVDANWSTFEANSSTSSSELYHPSKVPLLQRVSCWAVALCTVLYAGMGWTTLADFGAEHVGPNILRNYNLRDGLMQVAAAGMAVAVLAAFPLNIFPSRVTCLQWQDAWRKRRRATTSNRSNMANANLTEALLQDNGSNSDAALPRSSAATPIFPDISEGGTPQFEMESSDQDENDRIENSHDAEVAETTFEDEFGVEDEMSTDWVRHVGWTLVLTGTALGLALVVPDISVVFSVLGGTTSSWLGFCVPGLLGLRLGKDAVDEERSWIRYILSWTLLLGGILIGVLTTILTVQSLS